MEKERETETETERQREKMRESRTGRYARVVCVYGGGVSDVGGPVVST